MLVPSSDIEKASRLNDLRQRVLRGETINPEEYSGIIDELRVRRKSDIEAAGAKKEKATKKTASKKETTDAELDDILGGLGL